METKFEQPFTRDSTEEISIPDATLASWRETVDLMTEALRVPAGLIVRWQLREQAEILVCSQTPKIGIKPGQKISLDAGPCSKTVIGTGRELLGPNAQQGPSWGHCLHFKLGPTSYRGVPLAWPTGRIFGAICIPDDRDHHHSELSRRLLGQFQAAVQLGLQAVYDHHLRAQTRHEISRLHRALGRVYEEVEQRVRARTVELNQANEALRESEARFRTLVDHAPEAMIVMDMDTMKISDANNKAEQLFGFNREELFKMGPAQVSPLRQPDGKLSSEAALTQVAKAAAEGVNVFEWVHCNAAGNEILCEVRLARLPASGRNLFRASIMDITEHKAAEKALIQSENKYRTIFDHISEGLAFVGVDGRFLEVNPAYCQMLGYSRGEMSALSVKDILHPDSLPVFDEFSSAIQKSAAFKGEVVHFHKDGRLIHTEVQGRAFKFKGKDCLLGALRDITERKQAEEALRESEERVRLLLDSTAEAIYGLDLEGKCTFCNPSTLRLLGYQDQTDLLGKNMHELIHYTHPDGTTYPVEDCHACQAFRNGKGFHVKDELFWRADGTCFPVEYRSFPIRKQGQVLGAVVTFLDITESKQAEQALAKSENQFRSIFENSAMGVILLDLEGRLVRCNPAFCAMIGYPEPELTAMRFKDFTHPEDIPKSLREFKELLAGEREYYQFEKRYITSKGDSIWTRLTVSRIGTAAGLSDFVLAMVEDVTDHRKAEQALLQSEERYRTIFDNISDGLSVHDFEGRFLEVNPADCKMHGYSKEEMMALTVPEMVHPDCLNVFEEYKESIEKTGFYQGDVKQFRKDGSLINVEVKGTTINLENKQYLLAIVRDITERKRAEEELRKYREHLEELVEERTVELADSKEQAEAANRAKSVFLANMSHELRTPLNAILGFSQLMQRDASLADSSREKLKTINRSGEHLLGLINDVLEVSKIEAGHIALNRATFDFSGLLEDIEAMFGMRAEQKGLRFGVEKPRDLPRYLVGDEGKLRQVLINLLGNAVKFTEAGHIMFRVRLSMDQMPGAEKKAPGQWLALFEVEDTGAGIAPEETDKLFQPFEQTFSGQTKGGTGLGLAISREYAHLMGGSITARSEPGKGSLFTLACRFEEGREEAVPRGENARRVVGLAPDAGPKTILVVDDKEESRRFVAELLSLVGFVTLEAANGEEALALLEAQEPDLVLMDMRMPVMDGYKATRRLKATDAGRNTPVIAVSASALTEERDQILATGADEFICKPFRESELFEGIGRLLGLEYRYAGEKAVETRPEEPATLTPQDLEQLPAGLREELRRALLALNVGAIRDAVERICMQNRPVGEAMRRLEREYQFEILLELVN